VKMVAQVAAILILILGQGHLAGFFWLGTVALWIATLSALVSAADYFRRINLIMGAPAEPIPAPKPEAPAAVGPARAPSRDRISA
jgi:hypothetical protein